MGGENEVETPGPGSQDRWRMVGIAAICLGAGLLILGLILLLSWVLPADRQAPTGKLVVSVAADDALRSMAMTGDVVQLYDASGEVVPELRYLEVYQVENGSLLVLAEECQAAALARQKAPPKVVLAVHRDAARAAELLEAQARINHPEISLSMQETATLAPGGRLALEWHCTAEPEEGIVPDVNWISSDPAVVTVEGGTIQAVGVGTAQVTASCGTASASCTVTVAVPLTAITLDKTEAILFVDEILRLMATAEPENATGFSVTWYSDSPDIVTVDKDGTLTGISPGTALVTASCGEITATCSVTVGVHAEMVQLNPTELTLAAGATGVLEAATYPKDVLDARHFTSSDEAVATVSEDGTVTASAPGVVTITFSCGDVTATCTVTVTPY